MIRNIKAEYVNLFSGRFFAIRYKDFTLELEMIHNIKAKYVNLFSNLFSPFITKTLL
jgi:hypothetical protein